MKTNRVRSLWSEKKSAVSGWLSIGNGNGLPCAAVIDLNAG